MLYDYEDIYEFDNETGTERIEHLYGYALGDGNEEDKFNFNFIYMKIIGDLFDNFYIPQLDEEERLKNHFNQDEMISIDTDVTNKIISAIDNNFFSISPIGIFDYPYEEDYWAFMKVNLISVSVDNKFFYDLYDNIDDDLMDEELENY